MMSDSIKTVTNCPTCGAECTIGGEGDTHYYVPSMQSELESVKQERDELAAHVNELRNMLDRIEYDSPVIKELLACTPEQSLKAHDREVRNQKARDDMQKFAGLIGKTVMKIREKHPKNVEAIYYLGEIQIKACELLGFDEDGELI